MFGSARYLGATITAAIALAAAPGPAAEAATAQQTIAELNAQRAENGLPSTITENPTWSADCAAHDHYMSVNNVLTHSEDPASTGYSLGGAFAAENADLLEGAGWNAGDPYEFAPLHLDLLLAPRLSTTGSADAEGYSCTMTWPGLTGPDPSGPTVYTYPGDGATIYASEVAREEPFTPGDLVGLQQPVRTGPYLFVFADAPGQSSIDNPVALSGATLTGPGGPVQVRIVDGETPVPSGSTATLSPYIVPSGFIIPVSPLTPGVTYHGHVLVTFAGTTIAHDWAFATHGADPESAFTARGNVLSFSSSSPAPIRVTFTRANGAHAPAIAIAPDHHARIQLSPGSWEVCGNQPPVASFASYDRCISILETGIPWLHFGPPRVTGATVSFVLRYASILHGRRATLTITPITVRCIGPNACTTTPGKPTVRRVALRMSALTFPLPSSGHGFRLALSTNAFQLGDAPWTAARTTSQAFVRS